MAAYSIAKPVNDERPPPRTPEQLHRDSKMPSVYVVHVTIGS